jgi:hypothetical protein
LLDRRHSGRTIGKNWIYRFYNNHPSIKARFSRSRDAQQVKNEDLYIIKPWFEHVLEARQKYSITDKDIYNFDETGFAIGLITGSRSSKVVILSESVGRATVIQPGNCI